MVETAPWQHGGLTDRVWRALADAGAPLTPAQVRQALGGDLAYTTVMTVLTRLVVKGAATRDRAGRGYAYTAVIDPAELTARRMRRLLDDGGDRAAVLARFVDVISAEDERLLGDLLATIRDENTTTPPDEDHTDPSDGEGATP